jgi:hypothetical protein
VANEIEELEAEVKIRTVLKEKGGGQGRVPEELKESTDRVGYMSIYVHGEMVRL